MRGDPVSSRWSYIQVREYKIFVSIVDRKLVGRGSTKKEKEKSFEVS